MPKKRVLFHTENHSLNTGYSIYCRNVLEHLYKTGKYELAEFSIYCTPEDRSIQFTPWMVYPALPSIHNQEANIAVSQNKIEQFGRSAFNDVVLDFKPDIVCSIFDYWYSSYMMRSPFRRFFKMIWMPTVDSCPQRHSWIDTYKSCDKVLAYSYFGKKVLEQESGGKIKNILVASPSVEESFIPSKSRSELKKEYGIPEDSKIAMMVSRNQLRKLFTDVIESFEQYIDKTKAKNRFLYLHTTNPDGGYDLDYFIGKSSAINNILVTYICKSCGYIKPSIYRGVCACCPRCDSLKMVMPNVSFSLDRGNLADLMSIADLGILAAIGEGWGMSISEFKKLGVPVAAVPYSAMEEQVLELKIEEKRHLGGIPIKIARMFTESSTQQKRALFDQNNLTEIIELILDKTNETDYNILSKDAKRCANEYFTWEKTSLVWEESIDSIEPLDQHRWEDDKKIYPLPKHEDIPDYAKGNIEALVRVCISKFFPHSYFTEFRINEIIMSMRCGKDLIEQFNKTDYNFNIFFNFLRGMIQEYNRYEEMRVPEADNKDKIDKLNFILT